MRPAISPIVLFGALILILAAQGHPMVNAQSRMLYGYVYSSATGKPITATVTVSRCSNQQAVTTRADGSWDLSYEYGTLGTLTFSAPGYSTQSMQLNMNAQWYYSGGVVSLQLTQQPMA
jgi:hypothetical protein